jgi:hypothetical protein
METTIEILKVAKKAIKNKQIELLEDGISFFSLTMQDLEAAQEELDVIINNLKPLKNK